MASKMTLKSTLEAKLLEINELCKGSVESPEDPYRIIGRIESISTEHEYDNTVYKNRND